MIYTITVNPAVDYHMDLTKSGLCPGQINRSSKEELFPGGKGINVSVILSRLGVESTAWGFAAGKTGRLLEAITKDFGCRCDFIYLPEGETRINVKLDYEQETAVNGTGPQIGRESIHSLLDRIGALTASDTLVLSGNLPGSAEDLYQTICGICSDRGIRFVVDAEGEALHSTFRYRPFLIKPNQDELLEMYHSEKNTEEEIISLMHRAQEEGAVNVFVTLGGDGALLLTEDGMLYRAVLENRQPMVSTVGAGDSSIGGFLAGLERYDGDAAKSMRLACAAGTATAYRKWLASGEEIEAVLENVSVKEYRGKTL